LERRLADHSQLRLPRSDAPLNLSRVADPEAQVDAGIRGVEPAQHGGEQVGPRGGARPDNERSTAQPSQISHGPLGATEETQGLPGVWLKQTGGLRRPDASSMTLEQPHAEVGPEALEVLRDRRLTDVARSSRPPYSALVEDGKEQLEAVQGQAGFCHKENVMIFIHTS
jgi:hypothetical protein